jgi:GT2 family glycosyltransferase
MTDENVSKVSVVTTKNDTDNKQSVAVLIAVFNRWSETKKLLDQLLSIDLSNFKLDIWVCDDGSSDSTAEQITSNYKNINLVRTSGNLFWAKAMNLIDIKSFAHSPDYVLWLNNDTVLFQNFFVMLEESSKALEEDAILVGALCDPETKKTTYSGCLHWRDGGRDEFRFIPPVGIEIPIGMFSGNCVFIPASIRRQLGPVSKTFSHGWADMDYGMRAKRKGFKAFQMPQFAGMSAINPLYSFHTDPSKKLSERLQHAFGRKGYNPFDYIKFCFRALPPRRALMLFMKNMKRMFFETLAPSIRVK